tara:strand:+ start:235 stop:537 length:303 start_codon:yes stop_codon:yes gene_type:complete
MKNLNTKTLVDTNNILWTFDYDMVHNSVEVLSDYSVSGGSATINQYSMDNALGHDIPEHIIASAQDMIAQDNDDLIPLSLDDIIESYTDERTKQVKQFYA